MNQRRAVVDTHQPFWQLASIILSAASLPLVTLGSSLAERYGAGTALLSIIMGNLLLWLIGLSIVAMSSQQRIHSIENIKKYLPKWGSASVAIILLAAFLLWVAVALESAAGVYSRVLEGLLPQSVDLGQRIAAAIGILAALVATGAIRWIKWFCVGAFPLLVCFFLWSFFRLGTGVSFTSTWGLSLPATLTAVAIALPGFVNFPTFFRHSRSKPDSFLSLSIITLAFTSFEASGIWIQNFYTALKPDFYTHILMGIIALSTICTCLINIYFASASLETITPKIWQSKEYAIIGLVGTVIYIFIQLPTWTSFLISVFTGFVGCICIILIVGFLIQLVVLHRPRPYEKTVNAICWIIGCIVVLLAQWEDPSLSGPSLMEGASATALALIFFILIEETWWSLSGISFKLSRRKS